MSELQKLRDLAKSDRVLDLEQLIEPDIQLLWENCRYLNWTDEEVRTAIRSLAKNEYLRRRANSATDEHIREVNRQRRIAKDGER